MVNEMLATVSLDDVYIPVDTAHFFDRTKAGINYPYIFPTGKLIPTRIPTANITGLTGLNGGPYPSHSAGPIYTIIGQLTWVKGSHTLKFGFITRSRARTTTTKSTSAPARPAPTTRTASSPSPTHVRARPRAVTPSATRRWACSTRTPNSGSALTPPSAASSFEALCAGFVEGHPEADDQLRRALHRDRSLSRAVGQHDRVRSERSTIRTKAVR